MGTVDMQFTPAEKDSVVRHGKYHLYKLYPIGRPGDTFTVDGRQFEIVDVSERTLETVASRYYDMEGYDSPVEFLSDWKERYSLRDPELRLYVHWFRKIDGLYPGD